MKKIICLTIVLMLCISMVACDNAEKHVRSPANFYYRTTTITYENDEGVIAPEIRDIFGHEEDYAYVIALYLNGPTTENCISPFPAGTKLESFDMLKGKALIQLSSHISLISGSQLTIACACLARTVLDLTGMDAVTISAKDDLLDGETSITYTKSDFLLYNDVTDLPSDPQ